MFMIFFNFFVFFSLKEYLKSQQKNITIYIDEMKNTGNKNLRETQLGRKLEFSQKKVKGKSRVDDLLFV
jgi:hypothetical protein